MNDSELLEENHWYKVGRKVTQDKEGNQEINTSGKTKARGDHKKETCTLRIHMIYEENRGRTGFLRVQGMGNAASVWG